MSLGFCRACSQFLALLWLCLQARGFLEYNRAPLGYRPVDERITDWGEVMENAPTKAREDQLYTQVRTPVGNPWDIISYV